jgi:hypothetical protein
MVQGRYKGATKGNKNEAKTLSAGKNNRALITSSQSSDVWFGHVGDRSSVCLCKQTDKLRRKVNYCIKIHFLH